MKNKGKNYFNYIIIFVCVIIIIIGLGLIKRGLSKDNSIPNVLYTSTINRNGNYTVTLYNNNFYQSPQLIEGYSYPARGIQNIDFDLKYNFKGSEKTKINYTYSITAEVIGSVNGTNNNVSPQVWNKLYTIMEQQPLKEINGDNFLIDEKVPINYAAFNNLKNNYENTYGIKLDALLKIKLNIIYEYIVPKDKSKKEERDYIELIVPLSDTITNVKSNFKPQDTKEITETKIATRDTKQLNLYFGIVIIIFSSVILFAIYKKREISDEMKYIRNINKILKDYAELIVTVTNKPTLTGLRKLQLANLEDLIDVAEQTQANIVHYEEIKNKSSVLLVMSNGYVYIYTVTSEDI